MLAWPLPPTPGPQPPCGANGLRCGGSAARHYSGGFRTGVQFESNLTPSSRRITCA